MSKPKQAEPPPLWHPACRYAWSRKQIQAWIDAYGLSTPRDGVFYKLRSKSIAAGRYEVWFEPVESSGAPTVSALLRENKKLRAALEVVATGIHRDKARNLCWLSGAAAAVHAVEDALGRKVA